MTLGGGGGSDSDSDDNCTANTVSNNNNDSGVAVSSLMRSTPLRSTAADADTSFADVFAAHLGSGAASVVATPARHGGHGHANAPPTNTCAAPFASPIHAAAADSLAAAFLQDQAAEAAETESGSATTVSGGLLASLLDDLPAATADCDGLMNADASAADSDAAAAPVAVASESELDSDGNARAGLTKLHFSPGFDSVGATGAAAAADGDDVIIRVKMSSAHSFSHAIGVTPRAAPAGQTLIINRTGPMSPQQTAVKAGSMLSPTGGSGAMRRRRSSFAPGSPGFGAGTAGGRRGSMAPIAELDLAAFRAENSIKPSDADSNGDCTVSSNARIAHLSDSEAAAALMARYRALRAVCDSPTGAAMTAGRNMPDSTSNRLDATMTEIDELSDALQGVEDFLNTFQSSPSAAAGGRKRFTFTLSKEEQRALKEKAERLSFSLECGDFDCGEFEPITPLSNNNANGNDNAGDAAVVELDATRAERAVRRRSARASLDRVNTILSMLEPLPEAEVEPDCSNNNSGNNATAGSGARFAFVAKMSSPERSLITDADVDAEDEANATAVAAATAVGSVTPAAAAPTPSRGGRFAFGSPSTAPTPRTSRFAFTAATPNNNNNTAAAADADAEPVAAVESVLTSPTSVAAAAPAAAPASAKRFAFGSPAVQNTASAAANASATPLATARFAFTSPEPMSLANANNSAAVAAATPAADRKSVV